MIDVGTWDLAAMTASWRAAQPFAHVAVDALLDAAALAELRAGIAREPHWPNRGEIFEMMASGDPPRQPALRAFLDALGSAAVRDALAAVTGRALTRADGMSYVYLAGSYLLPHTDHRDGVDRRVAYVYYLSQDGAFTGGELDLYACTVDSDGEIAATAIARTLPPRENRLLLFDVGPTTVHRVREVTAGARVSLAGWFY
jgi:hypothetical protein